MAGRRGSTISVLWLVVVAGLLMVGNGVAQPPGSQPIPAPTLPDPAPNSPPALQTPPVMPAPTPTPTGGSGFSGPGIPFGPGGGPGLQPASLPPTPRFDFKIDPKAPVKDLLPTPPQVKPVAAPILIDDLTKVLEAEFQARPEKVTQDGKLTEQVAHQLAKINHLNAKKTDAFLAALLESRPDLAGLPFAMGDDCRTSGERTRQFTIAVNTVRQALGGGNRGFNFIPNPAPGGPNGLPIGSSGFLVPPAFGPGQPGLPGPAAGGFWPQYTALCEQEDTARPTIDKTLAEHVTIARIAALTQMLAPESSELKLGLVKHLTGVPHVEATRALARLAIFSAEEDVRLAAITSLKVRREKDYTDILVKGLRYPWPAVAKRSADAITRIGRTDLIPELVTVLTEDDPRMPTPKDNGGKKVSVVREMVKINHHRNCMMCHPPGNPGTVAANAITAEVPVQGQPLPSPAEGYRQSSPDLMIRIDVTYLRQDFSAMMPVSEAHPWPELQRFDFMVRERKLTAEEAVAYREKLTPKEAGVLSPYHRAALAALRELTGKDAAPTAEAWRKLLALQVKTENGDKPRD